MKVDQETVRKIARLARIKITDTEAKSLEGELSAIMQWVEQLEEVDTTDVAPLKRIVDMPSKMRADKVSDGGYPDDVVQNAPAKEDHFFMVPKVVE